MTLRTILMAAALAVLPMTARADEAPVTTQHQITVAGKPIRYTAEAGRVPIRDAATGEPHGFMFYTAYRVASAKPRPVTFVWNGGPGAASTLLHFEAAGPRRLDGGRLIDNADTWLTNTDLVFVDPIGTGYSRPAKTAYEDEFYGTLGDVASVTEFVRAWRLLHGDSSPVYLAGESWGAGRAANVGYALLKRGVPVAGLVLISGGSGLKADFTTAGDLGALRVANLAATALHHGKLAPGLGTTPDAARAATEAWVRQIYIPALKRLESLTDAERDQIVAGLARVTGLPADKIDRKTLAITPRQFRTNLVPGKTLDTFDMRIAGPEGGDRTAPLLLAYFAQDLNYRTDLPYVGLETLDQGFAPTGKLPQAVGTRWNYATAPVTPEQQQAAYAEAQRTGAGPPQLGPPLPATTEAVALNPKLKVLVATGVYDSLGNCAADVERAKTLAPPLKAAMRFRCYVGGHMMYRDAVSRVALTKDVRALVAQ